MTRDKLFFIALTDVKVTRRREREDLGDIESLATSILKVGQLQPIVVDQDNELIAGGRRLEAFRLNGTELIEAIRRDDVDEELAKEMELEENLARKQMTWREQSRGLAELDRIRRARNPNWTQVQTAQAAGGNTSQRDVSIAINMEKMIELFPEIGAAKNLPQAQAMAKAKAASISRVQLVKSEPKVFAPIEEKIWLGDSVQLIKDVQDESFNLVLTDPPFGIRAEDRTAGSVVSDMTHYKDDEDLYEYLLTMMPDIYRVLKPNSFFIWFLGMTWYERVKIEMRKVGFTVDEIPIIWDRTDGRSFTARPDRWFGKGYDIALHAIKGEPRLARPGSNIIKVAPVPQGEKDLLFERPVDLYAELIRRTTVEGESIADFFVGSGSCPAAAASLGRDFFGIEKDPERRAKALLKIKSHLPEG